MKKIGIIFFILVIVVITLFSSFDGMKLSPLVTGEEFLGNQPYIMLGDVVLTQPSSTIIVYFLGIFIILLGVRFLKKKEQHLSKKWWGISMIFGV